MLQPSNNDQHYLVSSYPDTFAKVPNQVLSIFKVFEIVESDDLKQRIELLRKGEYEKIKLPAFIPSGTSGVNPGDPVGVRTDHVMWDKGTASNIICLDIDYTSDMYALKMDCRDIPCVLGYFESPSGKGLKVFVTVSTFGNQLEDFKSVWQQVVNYFEARTKTIVDLKCKNLSRICYYSHDPYLYINSLPIPFQVDPSIRFSEPKIVKIKTTHTTSININDPQTYIITFTERKLGIYGSDTYENNWIYCFCCNCNRFNVDIETARSWAQALYDSGPIQDWNEGQLNRTVDSAYKHHQKEQGTYKFHSR